MVLLMVNKDMLCFNKISGIALTIETFLKRKIIVKTPETADKKLQAFQEQLVKDFDVALGAGAGENWFRKHVAPIAQRLRQSAF